LESINVCHLNEVHCDHYCHHRTDDDWQCYHHTITSEQQLNRMKQDIEEIKTKLVASFDVIEKNLR
jgi:hypothetical protein